MGLNDRPLIHPQFAEAMQNMLTGHERARVEIYDPRSSQKSTRGYDVVAGDGGNDGSKATKVWPSRNDTLQPNNAWIQGIGNGADIDARDPASAERVIRIHLDRAYFGSTDEIANGFQVQIVRGGDDTSLNGRLAIVRTTSTASTSVNRMLVCTISEKR